MFYKQQASLCDDDVTGNAPIQNRQFCIEDIDEYPPSPIIPLTQADVPETTDDASTESEDNCHENEAVLNCYFHVAQAFAKRSSYVKKMKCKTFSDPKGTAYRHVCNIASTKTVEQRSVVTQLYLKDWRESRDEKAAADHFEKEYCRHPKWNWNYACTGEIGIYPTNCPNESFNRHGIKSVATDCSKNASLASFLVHTAPRLLEEDSRARADACTIEIPRTASLLAVGITGFVREGIDIVQLGVDEYGNPSSWLANLRHKIGVPIDKGRIRRVLASLEGDTRPFEETLKLQGVAYPEMVADMMVATTKNVCHLQWKQGKIVGDCEDCVKYLGYTCPGAIFLRSKFSLLQCKVEVLRKSDANARGDAAKASARGNPNKLYQSGLSKSSKRRCLSKMIETFEGYLATLNHQQLSRLVLYLRLYPMDSKYQTPLKGKSTKDLLDTLVSFHDNPTAYRAMLLGRHSSKETSYVVVKKIARKLNEVSKSKMQGKENTT
ncbi:hypothetical protein SEMRO_2330_G323590.1 [Seminavis robusta]|uniref:Uncharacterized protein n=1 Tax=Seminavis robusta TaxID=568900 RepID=A0A9N8EYS6_9STRA|nr:hypothetical protein SEMRO_2330_G323590.1 [Seminavis robusta]|eukprot:Sro2330_g323590.1 n/a (493) ;mRNA; r:12405-13883